MQLTLEMSRTLATCQECGNKQYVEITMEYDTKKFTGCYCDTTPRQFCGICEHEFDHLDLVEDFSERDLTKE